MKLRRILARSLHPLGLFLVEWQMRSAPQMRFAQPCAFEHQLRDTNMPGLTRMRRACERDLFFRISPCIARSAREKGHRLERLACGAEERDDIGRADLDHLLTVTVDRYHGSTVDRLNRVAADHICKNCWWHRSSFTAETPRRRDCLAARLVPSKEAY